MKIYLLILQFTALFLSFIFPQDISSANQDKPDVMNIKMITPEIIQANQEITVTLEIFKSDLQGPAIISQKFPSAFKGLTLLSGDAEFRVDNQFIVISFSKMPSGPTFSVSYSLKIGNVKPAVYPISIDIYDPDLNKHSFNHFIKIDGIKEEAAKARVSLSSSQSSSKVRISLEHSDTIIAGMSFPVKMLIRKGTYTGDAKITQRVPPGFSVTKPTNIACDFASVSGEVSFSLQKMRPDTLFTLEYTIKVGSYAVGKYPITGVYSDGDGNTLDFSSFVTVINDAKTQISKTTPKNQQSIKVELVDLGPALPDKEYDVKIRVIKGNYSGFGRLIQIFPIGLNPEKQAVDGVEFEVSGNVVKTTWKEMPVDSVVELSYKIMISPTTLGIYPVLGVFETSKGKIDLEHKIVVKFPGKDEMAKKAEEIVKAKNQETSKEPKAAPVAAGTVAGATVTPPKETAPQATAGKNEAVETGTQKPVSSENQTPVSKINSPPPNQESKESQTAKNETKQSASPGVTTYRVQIGISNVSLNQEALVKRFGIKGPFFEYFDKGIYKYTVGEFTSRDAAYTYRKEIQAKGISDAFVIGFKDGVRVL